MLQVINVKRRNQLHAVDTKPNGVVREITREVLKALLIIDYLLIVK